MPLFDYAKLIGLSRDTPVAASGPTGGPAVQVGVNIQDDKVRRVWRLNVQNLDPAAAHVLTVYAADAANTQRRVVVNLNLALGATNDFPLNGARVESPFFVIPPVTSVAPTQENGIYTADETVGGGQFNVMMAQYDLRG